MHGEIPDTSSGGRALRRVGSRFRFVTNYMWDYFRESYFEHGEWKTFDNVAVAFLGFFGLLLIFSGTFTVALVPLDAVSSVDRNSGVSLGMLAAFETVAYAGWNARSDDRLEITYYRSITPQEL